MERLRKILPVFVLGLVGIIIWLERRAQNERQQASEQAANIDAQAEAPEGTTQPDTASSSQEAGLYAAAAAEPQADSEAPAADEPQVDGEPATAPTDEAVPEPATEDETGDAAAVSAPETASEAAAPGPEMNPQGWVEGDGSRDCPPNFPIKGNANSMIYHQPGESSYELTIPEICFATEEDAQAAGYRPRRH